MNKKFTMLVAALLAGGSFSAMAETFTLQPTATTIQKGAQIYLVAEDGTAGHSADDIVLGVASEDGTLTTTLARTTDTSGKYTTEDGVAVKNFLWTVEEGTISGTKYLAFKNAETGKYLAFDKNGTTLVSDPAKANNDSNCIYFTVSGDKLIAQNGKGEVTTSDADGDGVYELSLASAGSTIKAYKVETKTVGVNELNSVLGGDGFSLSPVGTMVADENNIFSQQIKAITFEEVTNEKTEETIPSGGMYFVVNAPKEIADLENVTLNDFAEEGRDTQDMIEAYFQAFNECTFVAVSASKSYETSEVEKEGLKLITISGAELVKYDQSKDEYKTTGDDVYVGNAVFTVTEPDQFGKPGEYQLSLAKARIKDSGKTSQSTPTSPLNIGVTKIQGVNYVTTTEKPSSFKISTSSLVKGIDLLKKEQAASVYTIKFVSGEDEENSEYGKYLASANGNQFNPQVFTLVAQGEDLIDITLPQYQFAITGVDVNDQKITFTNIETEESFETYLYATDVKGQYKLVGPKYNNIDADVYVAADEAKSIVNYAPEAMSAMVVQLDPVTVDAYAGFVKKEIDNNEPYRLVFARNATTDDKWYVAPDKKDETKINISESRSLQVVFEPVVKTNGEIDVENISTPYVYNKDGKVYKAAADLVNYYTYNLRVVDAENAYLATDGNGVLSIKTGDNAKDAATEFIAKYNYDGSVSLTNDLRGETTYALSLNDNGDQTKYNRVAYEVPNKDLLKLFLEEEELGVSLPAASGHFTFEAENGGFVNVSDANEGVIAIRTEAGEDLTFWVDTTDSEKIIPTFYISKAGKFMYNATDSLENYDEVHPNKTNPYKLIIDGKDYAKAMFKAGELVNPDTLKTTVDNKEVLVAAKANQNKGILDGIQNYQFQIVKPSDAEDNYVIRVANTTDYLANFNGVLGFITNKDNAMRVIVEGQAAPTANEGVSATEVKVIATDGAINIKNAAGKNVVISTILGQIVANEVLTSDNATISVPAGIAIVSIDGEEAVKVSVR